MFQAVKLETGQVCLGHMETRLKSVLTLCCHDMTLCYTVAAIIIETKTPVPDNLASVHHSYMCIWTAAETGGGVFVSIIIAATV